MVRLELKKNTFVFGIYFFYILIVNTIIPDLNPFLFTIPLLLFTLFTLNSFINSFETNLVFILIGIAISCLINFSFEEFIYFFCFFNMWYLKNISFNKWWYFSVVFFSIIIHFINISFFNPENVRGIIPFMNEHNRIPNYSINLFDNLSTTATSFFGLILFIYGVYFKKIKYFFVLLGIYLVLFGASRLALFLLLFSTIVKFFLKNKFTIIVFSLSCLLLPIFIYVSPIVLSYLPEGFLFLIDKGRSNYSLLTDPRIYTATEYISLISNSPFFGYGDIDFKQIFANEDLPFSELQLLLLTAKLGIPTIILFVFFFVNRMLTHLKNDQINYFIIYFIFIFSMIYYGSFLYAYNFLFLLLISVIHVKE